MTGRPNEHADVTSRRIIKSLKAEADRKRKITEKIADAMTAACGSLWFLVFNALWFVVWILWNIGAIPSLEPFDPYPFGLLTMIVSLEAIILAIFVLISQNRGAKVDDLREEVDLQVDIITEQELTKLMTMVALLLEKNGVNISKDEELQEMLRPTNFEKIKRALEKQVVED